jgi:hypothetical protein
MDFVLLIELSSFLVCRLYVPLKLNLDAFPPLRQLIGLK